MLERQAKLTAEVLAMGYRLAQIHTDASIKELSAPRNDVGLELSNYLAVPDERRVEIQTL
jgi:hypothetical protein